MRKTLVLAAVLMLAVCAAAQQPRTCIQLSGAPDDCITHEGILSTATDAARTALRCTPAPPTRFYGITVRELCGCAPSILTLSAYLEGQSALKFQLRIEDDEGMKSNDAAAWVEQELRPGWNALRIPLQELKSRKGARALDLRFGIRRLRLSRKADAEAKPFWIESCGFEGENPAMADVPALDLVLAMNQGAERERLLAFLLARMAPLTAVETGCQWIANAKDEQASAVARHALQHVSDAKAVAALVQRAARTGPGRVEILSSLARNSAPEAGQACAKLLADAKTGLEERVAVLRGSARVGAWAARLEACAAAGAAWPLRAALLEAGQVAGDAGLEAVIALTGAKESARVNGPAIAALTERFGTDLGHDTAAWLELWKVRKTGQGAGDSVRRANYGSFYGIPLDPGRIVFVLDGSGSMREVVKGGKAAEHIRNSPHLKNFEISTRLDLLKAELCHVIGKLPNETFVGIVFFNDEIQWLSRGLEVLNDQTRERLCSRVRASNAGQATNIHDGMWAAFHPTGKVVADDALNGPDTIVVLTDGAPSAGPVRNADILADAILRWNLGRAIRIHSVNVGDRASRWMKRVSGSSGGIHQDLSSDRTPEGNQP